MFKRIWKKVVAKSSPENQVKGQISTVIAGVLITISSSGIVDGNPVLKTIVDAVSGALIHKASKHALTTK